MFRGRENEHALPSWLEPLINASAKFHSECSTHEKKSITYFCHQCMGEPLCERCWMASHENQGHRYIKVYRASRRPCFAIADISKYVDLSDIQIYIINQMPIVYLVTDMKEDKMKRAIKKGSMCITCSRQIMDGKCHFCSIDCKVRSNINDVESYENARPSELVSDQNVSLMTSIHRVGTMEEAGTRNEKNIHDSSLQRRRRRRKGVPCRAPLF